MEEHLNRKGIGNQTQRIAERVLLLREYLYANASRTKAVRIEDMKQYLNDKGDNCGIKPIYRALAILTSDFDMKLEYSEKAKPKGWLLKNPPLVLQDVRLIVDSIQASKFITQEKAKYLTKKVCELVGAEGKESLNRPAYVYERIKSMNDAVVKDVDRIYQAILTDQQISFKYFHRMPDSRKPKEYSNSGKPIVVSPYALCWSNGYLYLYAFNGIKFAYYRIDRMDAISKPLPFPREGGEQYSEKDITAKKTKVFNMYPGTEEEVKIRFQNRAADVVVDEFGEQVNMMYVDASHFAIRVRVALSPTFYAWVASLGKRAKIMEPPTAIEGMKKFLQDASCMYEDDGKK